MAQKRACGCWQNHYSALTETLTYILLYFFGNLLNSTAALCAARWTDSTESHLHRCYQTDGAWIYWSSERQIHVLIKHRGSVETVKISSQLLSTKSGRRRRASNSCGVDTCRGKELAYVTRLHKPHVSMLAVTWAVWVFYIRNLIPYVLR